MSKQLVNLSLLPAKALITAYTWSTLPFYTAIQRPWRRLAKSRNFGVVKTIDSQGRLIYSRPCPVDVHHPYLNCYSFNEILPLLDKKRKTVGVREVISEVPQLDSSGNPVKVDGRELTKVQLADEYRWYTVGDILERADAIGRGLRSMGVKEGDKVILYADNSLAWMAIGLALQRMNAITVTLLSILNDEGIVYGINQCEARFLVTSANLLKKIERFKSSINNSLTVIVIPEEGKPSEEAARSAKHEQRIASLQKSGFTVNWLDELEKLGASIPPYAFSVPKKTDVSLIMYTSGTTGNPKGVMLTHEQLTGCVTNFIRFDHELDNSMINSAFLAYLPLGHLYGYLLNLGLFCQKDARIGLSSPLTMLDSSPGHVPNQVGDIRLIRPQFLPGVPLVLDRILKEIYRKLNSRSPIAAPLFTYLMDYKIKWRSRGYDSPLINRLVCQKINDQFGGRFKIMLIGSAPLSVRTQAIGQAALDIQMLQAYGSTEMAGATHVMANDDLTYGACGVPFHSVKYFLKDWPEGGYKTTDKPNPRGEVCVSGDIVSKGYYKMPEATAELFLQDPDGARWVLSGDIGEVLSNGTLKIIDRRKDLLKLANGEFVSLGKIESGLRSSPYVENICVCTDPYSNHVTALVSPNRKAIEELAKKLGKNSLSFDEFCKNEQVIAAVNKSLKKCSEELQFTKFEIPKAITLTTEDWTPENFLTAALKVKRREVIVFYNEQIKRMFMQTAN